MSMPQILTFKDVLDLVKKKLLQEHSNIEILEQIQYKSKITALPSLKTESLILFKNLDNNTLSIAKTDNLEFTLLSIAEFKEIASKLPDYEKKKIANIITQVSQTNKTPKV